MVAVWFKTIESGADAMVTSVKTKRDCEGKLGYCWRGQFDCSSASTRLEWVDVSNNNNHFGRHHLYD